MKFLAAVIQLTSTRDSAKSMADAEASIDEAASRGAKFVALPENVSFMGPDAEKREHAEPLDGPTFMRFASRAKAHRIYLLAGSLPERSPAPDRVFNTCVLFGPDGERIACYRKIHLFDVSLGEGATFSESTSVQPGTHAVLARLPIGNIGMTICYDVRFPDLFRALRRAGADVLTVPAAFTVPTGRDHWEVLLRARAIENQCYVLAPAQFGRNTDTRATFGRSMIIDPWGTVLAVAPDRPSIALAEIDLAQVRTFRRNLPCMEHERPDAYRIA